MPVETPSTSRTFRRYTTGGSPVQPSDTVTPDVATSVLFVVRPTAYGGAEKHLLDLIRRMRPSMRISVLCIGEDVFSERMNWSGAERISVRCEAPPASTWEWFRLFARSRAHVVVFVYNWFDAFTWAAPIAARLAGIPKLVAIQHLLAPPLPAAVPVTSPKNLLRRLFGQRRRRLLSLRLSSSIAKTTTICVSDAVRKRLMATYGFSPSRTITIHNGVHASEFAPNPATRTEMRARLELNASDFVFVFVGRLTEQKGVDLLLSAMSKTVREGKRCKCLIVGEGPLEGMLIEQASRLGLSNFVSFLGFQRDPRPFLQAADAFVLTSHFEGLPLAVLEAMACGLPCVVTDVAGNAEAVVDRANGFVVPARAVDEISAAMSRLLADPSETARMASESRARAAEVFDIDKQMAEIEQVILGAGAV
jgi:glycosyltransferase involved in cell wall biosynthesis